MGQILPEDDPQAQLLKEKLDQMNPQMVNRNNFLDAIQQVESSGGTDFNHPTIQAGLQAGQTAIGNYGLLPNTVQEIAKRAQMDHTATPEMVDVAHRDPASIKQTLEANPPLEKQYANHLAQRLLNKFHNPVDAAYSWNQGDNLTPQDLTTRNVADNPYVQKFQKIWHQLGNK